MVMISKYGGIFLPPPPTKQIMLTWKNYVNVQLIHINMRIFIGDHSYVNKHQN